MPADILRTIEDCTGPIATDDYNRLDRFSPKLLEMVAMLVERAWQRAAQETEEDLLAELKEKADEKKAEEEEAREEAVEKAQETIRALKVCPDCGAHLLPLLPPEPKVDEKQGIRAQLGADPTETISSNHPVFR